MDDAPLHSGSYDYDIDVRGSQKANTTMKISVLGSGSVGQTIGAKLTELGHEVKVGTRDPQKLADWLSNTSGEVSVGSFEESAAFGEIVFNCTNGKGAINALTMANGDSGNLNGKPLIDITNVMQFSEGELPTLFVCNTDSLGEQIQRAFPEAKVVKTLHTVTAAIMVNPALIAGEHDMFISGNDAEAKAQVTDILKNWFGWKSVIDLGDISGARATEMMMIAWLRLWQTTGTWMFNYKIVR
jgi:8-hydroxy-5-deazaflavin:NADPH oxidoreductase